MEHLVMSIIEIILSPLIAFVIGIFFLGLSRRIMARIHWRYGPPIIQPIIDITKLFNQRSISHGKIFNLGLILSLAASIVVVLFLPLGRMCPLSNSGGLLVILYVIFLGPLGIALSGGEAANPNTSIGISRKLILMLGYEVPLLLILLAVMTHYRTISIVEIVEIQQNTGWSFASLPLLLSGIAYLLILPAVLGIRPFDFVSAPQEISTGPIVEYSGQYLAMITIQHAFSLFIGIALFVNLFLGGGDVFIPLENLLGPAGLSWIASFLTGFAFFLKMSVVFVICLFINAAFPRIRIEQAVRYLWRWPTLFAFAGLIIVLVVRR
jgi:NADH-quinone oxidoreductase subunit H